MYNDDAQWTQLGKLLAQDIGDSVSPQRLERYETFLCEAVTDATKTARRRSLPLRGTLVAGALLTAGVFVILFFKPPAALPCWTGDDPHLVALHEPIATRQGEPRLFRFENGSQILLQQLSRLILTSSNQRTVTAELTDGSIDVDILKNGKTKWSISAGPFSVTVLGTKFKVTWKPNNAALDVVVERGVVLVEGGAIADGGIKVFKGNRLNVNNQTGYLALSSVAPRRLTPVDEHADVEVQAVSRFDREAAPETRLVSPTKAETSAESNAEPTATMSSHSTTQGGPARLGSAEKSISWTALYKQGKFHEALAEAEKIGIDPLLRSTDIDTLWKLMQTARNTGRDSIAEKALLACRHRFPNTTKARRAAFLLGDIAGYHNRNLVAASNWYEKYLQENTAKPLREAALGRLMLVYNRLQNRAAAANKAREYLRLYPDGIYDANARSILGN